MSVGVKFLSAAELIDVADLEVTTDRGVNVNLLDPVEPVAMPRAWQAVSKWSKGN